MGNLATLRAFDRVVTQLTTVHRVTPEVIAADLHPAYRTGDWAQRHAGGSGEPALHLVQHHHAHVASLLAEHGRLGEQMIGVAFDGTGYGADGAIWGGEILLVGRRPHPLRAGRPPAAGPAGRGRRGRSEPVPDRARLPGGRRGGLGSRLAAGGRLHRRGTGDARGPVRRVPRPGRAARPGPAAPGPGAARHDAVQQHGQALRRGRLAARGQAPDQLRGAGRDRARDPRGGGRIAVGRADAAGRRGRGHRPPAADPGARRRGGGRDPGRRPRPRVSPGGRGGGRRRGRPHRPARPACGPWG